VEEVYRSMQETLRSVKEESFDRSFTQQGLASKLLKIKDVYIMYISTGTFRR
jgi:hypothetical protein